MPNKKIILSHIFDASPEELWEAWTDPKQFAKWFNPAPGIDLIIYEYDVRVGGRMKFDMPQSNGDVNTQEGIFHKLDLYKEIVSGSPDKSFLIRVLFEKLEGKTKTTVEVTGVPPEYHAEAVQGWKAGFNKLEKILSRN